MTRIALAVGIVVALATPAYAGAEIDAAARGLTRSRVTVAKGADPTITAAEARRLRSLIERLDAPVFIAVLRERAVQEVEDLNALPRAVFEATDRSGAYGVIAGRNFRAASSGNVGLERGQAGELATASFAREHPRDNDGRVYPMLADWVRSVSEAIEANEAPRFAPVYPPDDAPPDVYRPFQTDPRVVTGSRPLDRSVFPPVFGIAFVFAIVAGIVGIASRHVTGPPPVGGLFEDGPEPLIGVGPRRRRERAGSPFDDDDDAGGGSWGSSGGSSSRSSFDDDRDSGGGSFGSSSGSSSSSSSSFDDDRDSGGGSW